MAAGETRSAERCLAALRFSGDISTKARATQSQFVTRLVRNLKDALAAEGEPAAVRRTHTRLFIELSSPARVATLARVFGVQTASLVERRSWSRSEDIVAAGTELFVERVRGKRFAVRARRVGDRSRLPVSAQQIDRELGAALLPTSSGVDLSQPELTVHVEILPGEAYFFTERVRGPGGLPLGVEGRGVALVSGGFDSAVAAWLIQKRGVALDYVFCNLGGTAHLLGALRVIKTLAERWSYGDRPRFHAIEFDALTRALRRDTKARYWQVLLKRLMVRAAEAVARERGALAIVTGEAVGQVSSQTLCNLSVISQSTPLAILRPLVGFNKEEITDLARRIGTYELSAVVGEYCAMVSRKPATSASLDAIRTEEARLDLPLLDEAVRRRSVFDIRTLDVEALGIPDREIERIPDGATVIDLRSKAAFDSWHHPAALRLDFPHALRTYRAFDRGKTYVLYCEFGLKSAHLAELMRREDLVAYHVKGGLKSLLRDASAIVA